MLPKLAAFKDRFYLAGGTGLALQLGHRQSIDFDFFTDKQFDTEKLVEELRHSFSTSQFVVTMEERNSLDCLVENVRLSFFSYDYPLLQPLLEEPYLSIASALDIGCMKLSAVVSRSTLKDYVDLYHILKTSNQLPALLEAMHKKMPSLDRSLVLKSLVYFDDVKEEPILYVGTPIPFSTIKTFLEEEVKKIKY